MATKCTKDDTADTDITLYIILAILSIGISIALILLK